MRSLCRTVLVLLSGTLIVLAAAARAQDNSAPATANPGRELVVSKCFQCHTDSMFRDQRQDRRAWEATIYRMVGRGGLWTPDEVKQMADYLAADFGPQAKAAAQPK